MMAPCILKTWFTLGLKNEEWIEIMNEGGKMKKPLHPDFFTAIFYCDCEKQLLFLSVKITLIADLFFQFTSSTQSVDEMNTMS